MHGVRPGNLCQRPPAGAGRARQITYNPRDRRCGPLSHPAQNHPAAAHVPHCPRRGPLSSGSGPGSGPLRAGCLPPKTRRLPSGTRARARAHRRDDLRQGLLECRSQLRTGRRLGGELPQLLHLLLELIKIRHGARAPSKPPNSQEQINEERGRSGRGAKRGCLSGAGSPAAKP
jgi:hypothetical protein